MDELYIKKELEAKPIYLDLEEDKFNVGFVINDILLEARFAPSENFWRVGVRIKERSLDNQVILFKSPNILLLSFIVRSLRFILLDMYSTLNKQYIIRVSHLFAALFIWRKIHDKRSSKC